VEGVFDEDVKRDAVFGFGNRLGRGVEEKRRPEKRTAHRVGKTGQWRRQAEFRIRRRPLGEILADGVLIQALQFRRSGGVHSQHREQVDVRFCDAGVEQNRADERQSVHDHSRSDAAPETGDDEDLRLDAAEAEIGGGSGLGGALGRQQAGEFRGQPVREAQIVVDQREPPQSAETPRVAPLPDPKQLFRTHPVRDVTHRVPLLTIFSRLPQSGGEERFTERRRRAFELFQVGGGLLLDVDAEIANGKRIDSGAESAPQTPVEPVEKAKADATESDRKRRAKEAVGVDLGGRAGGNLRERRPLRHRGSGRDFVIRFVTRSRFEGLSRRFRVKVVVSDGRRIRTRPLDARWDRNIGELGDRFGDRGQLDRAGRGRFAPCRRGGHQRFHECGASGESRRRILGKRAPHHGALRFRQRVEERFAHQVRAHQFARRIAANCADAAKHFLIDERETVLVAGAGSLPSESFGRSVKGRHAPGNRGFGAGKVVHKTEVGDLDMLADEKKVGRLDVQVLETELVGHEVQRFGGLGHVTEKFVARNAR
jgi:hypothetical protein